MLIGHLGNKPEIRKTPSGDAVASFSVATNEKFKDKDGNKQEKTTWHRCVCWGKRGEAFAEFHDKGDLVCVEGKIENRSYEDKDGTKKYSSDIIVARFEFVRSGSTKNSDNPPAGQEEYSATGGYVDGEYQDDLPF